MSENILTDLCVPSEDSNKPVHLHILIRLFIVCMKNLCVLAIQNEHRIGLDKSGYQVNIFFISSQNIMLLYSLEAPW